MPKLKSTRLEKIKLQHDKLARQKNLPYSTYEIYQAFYQLEMEDTFPELNMLFLIYLAIPVTSVSAERSFSTLKRIKNWMRTTTGQERLSNLAILNIERDLVLEIDIENVIKVFAGLKDRRCQF